MLVAAFGLVGGLIALVVGTGLWTDGKSIAGALIVIGGLGMAVGGGLTVLGLRR